jgi:hypothetical protein
MWVLGWIPGGMRRVRDIRLWELKLVVLLKERWRLIPAMGDQKFISKWEKRRTAGLFKYSLLCSVVITGAGFLSAIIGTIAGHGDIDRSFMRSSTIYGVAVAGNYMWR